MLVESVGSSLILGKLRGGELKNILDIQISRVEFIVGAALIQSAAAWVVAKEIEPLWQMINANGLWVQLTVYILLFWGLAANIGQRGFSLIGVGVLLNFIVIMANGGRMPVDISGIQHMISQESIDILQNAKSLTHIAANETTRIWILGDIIHLRRPYPMPKSLSIGDVFMMIGIFILIQGKILNKET
ncbi:conserved hypothetical protein [Alkaliphilus metalliredigens QYMF]|uniref:DUF5317 domain-containing protein n=1 Tax=Alkaliphilus metalliredigens (strain QYMF) TaxID=293826 RepID=A6TUF1_ALKMQ|nr:DUF5317 domain-containing protein [Alkaliphilus metalliredigens]ABR49819.1 conserved hypothetical protein [Alkaliphilus metalliredigens QYMF]